MAKRVDRRERETAHEKGASDNFTERERPCARCGATFTTTPKRRLLCERCWKEYG